MELRHKVYLRLNLVSIVFIAISFISVTLAWFAFSGLSHVSTEIGVKAWYIELNKDGQPVSNDIIISLSDIYPGMDIVDELVSVKNLGDSDAMLSYQIVSARILGDEENDYTISETVTSNYVEDKLSHDYPFHININLSKNYILSKGQESIFEVSVSWPLDSDTDSLDSTWGSEAYKFQKQELDMRVTNPEYQVRPSIQVVISLTAEQYITSSTASDPNYNLGDTILYDVASNRICTQISSTCISTYVIDTNNTLGDTSVNLLPNPKNAYITSTYDNYTQSFNNIVSTWNATTRPLVIDDIMKIVSRDVVGSQLVRDNLSNSIIGNITYPNRMTTELNKLISYNGYYKFSNQKFENLSSNNCYWTSNNYNLEKAFAVKKIDENATKIYGEDKTNSCNVIPVISALKTNLK